MKKSIINIILLIILLINTIIFTIQFNDLNFINKIIPIIINIVLLIILSLSLYFIYQGFRGNQKFKKTVFVISILLNIILLIFNISTNFFDKVASKITSNEVIYSSTIIVKSDSKINNINDLNHVKIGISENEEDYENYKLGYEYLEKNNKINNNTFYKYSDYTLALNDLLEGNIDALIISSDYAVIYSEYFEDLSSKVKEIIRPLSKSVKKVNNVKKELTDPITVLVIGADGNGGEAYNADVLILMTINPITKNVVMVDVVRDTYAYNLGNNSWDKITHSGWYGNEKVMETVSNLFDINIDYYVKFNFTSVKELVDLIGGVEMDVPYRYIVETPKGNYYINPGRRKLNGTETLFLARTRKLPGSSLYTRGEMQMSIIEQVTKQVDSKLILNNFFEFANILGNNIKTNASKQELYYLIQKYITIKDDLTFSHNQLRGINSHYYHPGMRMTLFTIKIDENKLEELKTLLKENLNN